MRQRGPSLQYRSASSPVFIPRICNEYLHDRRQQSLGKSLLKDANKEEKGAVNVRTLKIMRINLCTSRLRWYIALVLYILSRSLTPPLRRVCTTIALNATDVNEESIRRMESRAPSDDMEAAIAKTSAKDLQDNVRAGFLQKRSMYKHVWKSRSESSIVVV